MKYAACALMTVLLVPVSAPQAGADGKSLSRAMLYSLLLPGAGEVYMGYNTRAKAHIGAEVGVWAGFFYFEYQGDMREDTYKELARINAGVAGQRDDDYYQAIAYYISNEVFNVDMLREARFYYPDDRDLQLEYWEQNGYFDEDAWEWTTAAAMDEYRTVRTESRKSYRRATMMLGFGVLNRMVSVIGLYIASKAGEEHAALTPRVSFDAGHGGGAYLYLNLPLGK